MVSMLAYSGDKTELREIVAQTRDLAAYLMDERWDISCCSTLNELAEFFADNPLVHLACYDVTETEGIDYLRSIRSEQGNMLLMLIADTKMSPMEYVRPDILASSLILRPFCVELLRDKLRDLIQKYLEQVGKENGSEFFLLESREGRLPIPYRRIYYMEARDKRIYVRLRDREYAFYDTLDELEQKLPEEFVRCHRSFLINRQYVERVLLSQNEIKLAHDITVPLSRSYKPRFKHL